MSVRKIKKSYISSTGYFKSFKNDKQIAYESILERDFYMTLEFNSNVLSYEEQPLRIYYEYKDGIRYRYTPDCLVTYQNNIQKYFEVKYLSDIKKELN
ncbi:transposase endonuclease subunit TnsA [Aliarcobacter lanthieri]|nr:transposase endonuclease subunit TnsA [Aliarcobacter lanthieri]